MFWERTWNYRCPFGMVTFLAFRAVAFLSVVCAIFGIVHCFATFRATLDSMIVSLAFYAIFDSLRVFIVVALGAIIGSTSLWGSVPIIFESKGMDIYMQFMGSPPNRSQFEHRKLNPDRHQGHPKKLVADVEVTA